jgi:hypothetical protein
VHSRVFVFHREKRSDRFWFDDDDPGTLPSSSDQVSVSFITPQSSFNEVPNAQMRSHRRRQGPTVAVVYGDAVVFPSRHAVDC